MQKLGIKTYGKLNTKQQIDRKKNKTETDFNAQVDSAYFISFQMHQVYEDKKILLRQSSKVCLPGCF